MHLKLFSLSLTAYLLLSFSPVIADELKENEIVPSEPKLSSEVLLAPLTPHTATYNVFYGSFELGKAHYELPATDSNYYTYHFNSEVGLLMLSDKRNIRSEFLLENNKLIPFRYLHKRSGTGSDYEEQTAFTKAQNFIHTIYKLDALKLPYEEDVFDPLMVQLQFRMDLAANKKPLNFSMVKEKELDDYQFRIVAEEKMTIQSGTYDTVKIEVIRDSSKRQTYFWMAKELAYLPVRLSHFSKGSKQLDIQLHSYQFDQSLPQMPAVTLDELDPEQAQKAKELMQQLQSDEISSDEIDEFRRLATEN
ncbi:DUF3108 domain-containing protein [Shewanella maritima]|uniref:DUF3108 domain-containing protein n=1 Tax=Shewanella maritima TaxID=2520507 RepID=UPI0037365F35